MTELIGLAPLLGTLVGLVLGLTGAGGGVLAVPALMLGLGMNLTDATPVSLIAVGAAASLGAVAGLRNRQVRYRAALLMAGLGILSAPLGIWLAHRLQQTLLVVIFCTIMLLIAARMLHQARTAHGTDGEPQPGSRACALDPKTGRFRWNTRCSATLAGIGSVAGLFTGMLGVGGGFLIVPAFRQFSDLTMQAAAATSLAVIALVSTTTVIGTLLHGGQINLLGWTFIVTTGVGMLIGRILATRIPGRWLQAGFGVVVLLVAVAWLARLFV
ncbi:MAG: sulfite exporter TauE/SafE family protein [Azoarcus sp.]|nr:sulfite exporter TauE/SafE family protein [Azoarcus sp.]